MLEFYVSAAVPPSLPQPVADLTADVGVSTAQVEGKVTLTWTAPDAYTPSEGETVSQYTLKYATFSVDSLGGNTTSWWNTATFTLVIATAPQPPGFAESLVLTGLETGATFYFALRSMNSVISELSPIDAKAAAAGQQASAVIPNFPPPQPAGLAITRFCGKVEAAWAPVDTGVHYDFDRYRLFQSSVAPGGPFDGLTSTGTLATGVQTLRDQPQSLVNFTSYYFQVRAYDLRGLESTGTATELSQSYAVPPSATNLAVVGSSLTSTLFATWVNPNQPTPIGSFKPGLLVRTQGSPLSAGAVDFSTYSVGSAIGNGSVLLAWNASSPQESYLDANLASGATYHYYVFSHYQEGPATCYATAVSTSIVLQPRPMAPSGVSYAVDQFGISQIRWNKVEYFETGAPMTLVGGFPPDSQLAGYNVYKSTCSAGGCPGAATWVLVSPQPVSKSSFTYPAGVPTQKTYYIVRAVNGFSFESSDSNTVDSLQGLHAVAKAGDAVVAEVALPPALKAELDAGIAAFGAPYSVHLVARPEDQTGGVLRSFTLEVRRGTNGQAVPGFAFSAAPMVLALSNRDVSGLSVSARPAANANLDIFWFNGVRFLPMNGEVNAQTETVTVNTNVTGIFQLRSVTRANAFSFNPAQDLLPRVVTPNDDGSNDIIFFNTKVAGVTGKIFDMRGAKVTDLKACPAPAGDPFNGKCLYWDGKVGGKAVHSGVYIYDLDGQGEHFTGTVVAAQ